MKKLILCLILIGNSLFTFSQNITCKSFSWGFYQFNEGNDAIKEKAVIIEPVHFVFKSFSSENSSNGFFIDFYENGKASTLLGNFYKASTAEKNTYLFRVVSTDNVVHGVNFDNNTGAVTFEKQNIIITIGNYSIILVNYLTEISIE